MPQRTTPKGTRPGASSPPNGRRPATLDHLRAKRPPEAWLPICIDDDAQRAYREADEVLGRARLSKSPTAIERAEKELAQAERERDEHVVVIRLRAIGDRRYSDLVEAHPPTEEQIKEATERGEPRPQYDVKSFPPVLISACSIEPTWSPEEVAEITDGWNGSESLRLWAAAVEVCNRSNVLEVERWGKGSTGTRG